MADAVPNQAALASTTNSQTDKADQTDKTSVKTTTVETTPAPAAANPEKSDKPDTPSVDKDPGTDAVDSAPVSHDTTDASSSVVGVGAPAAVAASAPAPMKEGTKVAGQVRENSTPAPTKAEAGTPVENQERDTDSAMGQAAKEDKAQAAAAAEATKAVSGGVKKAADAAETTETRADDAAAAGDADKKEAGDGDDAPVAAADDEKTSGGDGEAAASTPAKPAKTHTSLARRKSVGQKLNRKGSKARIVHLDAKPGDHYFVKLKGYPAWPVIICDEDMLPQTLIKGRPVTAARPDGSYREDYADGGKRAADRTFPVMYLFTNEFGWVPNQDMHDLDPEKALEAINDKMRKDLQKAHQLAAESHPLSYYKDLLRQFQEELEQAEQAEEDKRQAAEAKRLAQATPKKPKKASKNEDVDMLDVPEDDDEQPTTSAQKKSKKRKAEDDARTPQRSDSVKKPKIKIMSSGTPKSNGTPASSSKNAKASDAKSKQAKAKSEAKSAKEASAPVETELDPEEKRRRKAKEVLFLRHKIQKGLLTRDQAPKEDEMKTVSDYLTKLEGFPDLEVGVIRETKINKVLKAILKIATIPREEDFKFKPRSQTLLEKWNKLLATDGSADAAAASESAPATAANGATTNGNAESKDKAGGAKSNGVKKDAEEASEEKKKEDKADSEPAAESEKPKEEPAAVEATA